MKIWSFITSLLVLFSSSHAQDTNKNHSSQVVVFVHGAWGGGWDYKNMQILLESKGYTVYRPTLTGLGEREHLNGPDVDLDTHIMDIVNVLKFEELTDIILVGHSYGGMVITGVAHRVPERIKHIIYMDAMLPVDGESVNSLMGTERAESSEQSTNKPWEIPPYWPDWGKDVPHPAGTFRQAISLGNPDAEQLPATYVLTIEPGAEMDSFSKFAERAKAREWRYFELPTGHNAQRTMPNEYAEIIMSID
jgi:pimeloyl-ACP methyl ester carboxylesterase